MASELERSVVAVVWEPSAGRREAVEAYLDARGVGSPRWYAPRDVDELDRALRAGQVGRVIFTRFEDLLEALWDERLAPKAWEPIAGHIECVEPLPADVGALAAMILARWESWHAGRRRARAAAGTVLSLLAAAAAFGLLLLTR